MSNFSTITIEEATERLIDYRGKTPPKTDSGVRLITAKVIKGGRIRDDPKEFIAADFYDEWMRRGLPQQHDILITTEAPLGEVAVLRSGERVALAQRVILLRAWAEKIDPYFLFYALQSDFGQGEIKARSSGTTVSGIKQSELRQVRLPIFPLPIQRRIAAVLSAYDDLIENNLRRIKILEEMASALYREWFVEFRFLGHETALRIKSPLGSIPEDWDLKALPECVDINPRVSIPREGEKPFVPMGSLTNDSMIIADIKSRAGNSGAKFQNDDTLFARITPCLENGKTGFVQFLPDAQAVAFGSTEFIVLRSRSLSPEFVYLLARSEEFRRNAIKSMSGASGRQRVQEKCFNGYTLAHPPRALLDQFSAIVSPNFRMIQTLHLQTENLRRTRDILLPRLFRGDCRSLELKCSKQVSEPEKCNVDGN